MVTEPTIYTTIYVIKINLTLKSSNVTIKDFQYLSAFCLALQGARKKSDSFQGKD